MRFVLAMVLFVSCPEAFAQNCKTWDQLKPLEQEVYASIENAKECSSSKDCELFWFDCPFGCGLAMNKSKVSRIKEMIDRFHAELCNRCYYKCRIVKGASCEQSRCIETFD